RSLYRERLAIGATGVKQARHHRCFAALVRRDHALAVLADGGPKAFGNKFIKGPPQSGGGPTAEQALSSRIKQGDALRFVNRDDGVHRRSDNGLQALATFAQGGVRLLVSALQLALVASAAHRFAEPAQAVFEHIIGS